MTVPSLVLASASPRRSALLTQLGLDHTVRPARVDEAIRVGEAPGPHVRRLAEAKARRVAADHPEALVLAGDTVVVHRARILGKPASADEAVAMLLQLSGTTHEVVSGLALAAPARDRGAPSLRTRVDRTSVTFRLVTAADARAYVASGEPLDKAGAYGIQGMGAALVTRVVGDYSTVVGLSVSGLVALLDAAGWRYRFGGLEPTDSPGTSP